MADDNIPNARFSLPAFNISQAPFLQSWNGMPSPFANTQDQIQQSMQISGVYPGQMPPNAFLGNTPARYAFGRTVPGTSPYVGALTNYMQGPGMQTGVNIGLLGVQGGIPGMANPPNGMVPPFPTNGSPGNYPPPGGYGPPNTPGAGNPAPPPFPGGAGGPPGPSSGPPPGSGGPLPPAGGGLLGGHTVQQGAARQQALQQTGMQALQGVSDPATRYMMALAYHIAPAQAGLTNDQINALEQSTMGSIFNKKTGQVQKVY